MGYFSNLDIEQQENNAHVQDQEPDMKEYMETDRYMEEFDKAFGNPKQQIDDMIEDFGF